MERRRRYTPGRMDTTSEELSRAKVLIIERKVSDIELLRIRLSSTVTQGVFLEASTMSDACEILKADRPDVIFLDLGMSDGYGVENVDTVMQYAPNATIIVMTGLNDEALALEALGRGAQDYLAKGRLEADVLNRSLLYAFARRESIQLRERIEREGRLSALGQVVGALSHQLNNPAGVVLSNVQMLDMILDDARDAVKSGKMNTVQEVLEELAECVTDVKYGAERIGEVIKSISSYTSGVLEVAKDGWLGDALTSSVEKLSWRLGDDIEVRQEVDFDVRIEFPTERLVQVLDAVLTNALEAMVTPREGGHVLLLKTKTQEEFVQVRIEDTGVGIQDSLVRQIFKPFYTSKEKHVGLGLTLANEIVRSYSGEIHVHPLDVVGTCVSLRIPRVKVNRMTGLQEGSLTEVESESELLTMEVDLEG